MSLPRPTRLGLVVAVAAIAFFTACSDLPVSPSANRNAAELGTGPLLSTTSESTSADAKTLEEKARKSAHKAAEEAKKAAKKAKKHKAIQTLPTLVDVLLWDKPVSHKSVTKVIGPRGGTISAPGGARIVFPEGAVSSDVTISVTRLAGQIVAYEFEPHGIRFGAPVRIELPTDHTSLKDVKSLSELSGAYFAGIPALNPGSGTATVTEFEPTFLSWDKTWVKFRIEHFSGYLVSTGRR